MPRALHDHLGNAHSVYGGRDDAPGVARALACWVEAWSVHGFKTQRITEDPLKTCPHCRSRRVKRLISRTSFALRGGGWYADGYGSSGGGDKEKSDEKPSGDSSPAKDSDSSSSTDSGKSKKKSSGGSKTEKAVA